ncbi:MAG: Fe-S cluster assembly protein SufD [Gemmatimonadaceae bacterium]
MTSTYLQQFANAASNGAARPQWLVPLRRSAIRRFEELGFPTMRNEDWHFTSVAPIAQHDFRAAPPSDGSVQRSDIERFAFGHPEWHRMVFVNSRFDAGLSSLTGLSSGVTVRDLSSAWNEEDALVESQIGTLAGFESSAFTALNTALMRDGALIHVAAGAAADVPIQLLFISDGSATDIVTFPRVFVLAERNSRATVIESYASATDATYFTNAVTEIRLGEGARVDHYKIQDEGRNAYHVGTVEARQERSSRFTSFSYAVGAALSRTNIYTTLDGPGAEAWLDGLYMVDGKQHVDHQTRIEHVAPDCNSYEVYKGVLDGSSHGVFNGKVYVHPEAQKTDGKQSNANLLLSPKAQIDTKPQLEIFADDVKCTHGATVGRLDENALFYMKSRGIGSELARTLLTYAFAAEVLERIELDAIREGLESKVLERFTGHGGLE